MQYILQLEFLFFQQLNEIVSQHSSLFHIDLKGLEEAWKDFFLILRAKIFANFFEIKDNVFLTMLIQNRHRAIASIKKSAKQSYKKFKIFTIFLGFPVKASLP